MLQMDAKDRERERRRVNDGHGFQLEHAVNVLDQQFSCSESGNGSAITTAGGSARREREMKRRKMNGYPNNETAHLSQVQQC